MTDTTEMQNFPMIRPTPLERAMGRFMRGPDHSAADDAGAGGGDDAGAGGGNDADAGADNGGDGADQSQDDDATILSAATADAGAGNDKGEGDKDGEGDGDDKAEADGPPENYELKVTVKDAEGKDLDIEIDQGLLTEATPVLKELGLTNEQANKLAPFIVEAQKKMAQRQADDFAATKADWAKEAKADAEIGGKHWKETVGLAARALDTFVGPATSKVDGKDVPNEFRQLLDETGLGNHPVMIRAFRKIGEAIGEDGTFIRSDATVLTKPDKLETLYPEDVPKTA